jgi:polyvinyl alcohol dehydrogenase (cytochrome)
MRWSSPLLVALTLLAASEVRSDCTSGTCIPGGGETATDCTAEFFGAGLLLNYPPYLPSSPEPKTELRCYEGDAGCDADGKIDGVCTFNVNVCLAAVDAALADCSVSGVEKASVKVKGTKAPELIDAVGTLLPAAAPVCTTGQTVALQLKGKKKEAKATVKVNATGSAGKDKDSLKLRCIRRDWPSHGFSHHNHRATPYETKIGTGNVASLKEAWAFRIDEQTPDWPINGVTATPTMGHGLLYVPAWNGILYALSPKNGKIKWQYEALGGVGIQSSAAVTADGRVIIVDGSGDIVVHCVDARTGEPLWTTPVGETFGDHVWSSPQVANNRVFIGVSGFTDTDAGRAPGRLVALDLDTGAILWQRRMVPPGVCRTDTAIACTGPTDCPEGDTCETAYGAGVTATPAIGPTGEDVFVNTVGSYTFPAVGDSDAIMRLDAATGDTKWLTKATPNEQFGACTGDQSIECGTDSACGAFAPCVEKNSYHDFGFLNGPLLVTADDGAGGTRDLVVSGSKDGSLRAYDTETGTPVWRNEVVPTPVTPGFAGYGLFNGAVGYAAGRFFAALYFVIPPTPVPDLQAFSEVDGTTLWTDEIGVSWSHVGVANGVLYASTEDAAEFYAYDAENGTRLATFALPEGTTSAGGAVVVDGMLFLPYGVSGDQGGVQAYKTR